MKIIYSMRDKKSIFYFPNIVLMWIFGYEIEKILKSFNSHLTFLNEIKKVTDHLIEGLFPKQVKDLVIIGIISLIVYIVGFLFLIFKIKNKC